MQNARRKALRDDVCMRALDARDARFDGVFFVAITSTGIYCRPVCPTRAARAEHRRFFDSAAAAERAGYRPCLRCRPELAPGLAIMDAVPRLACVAARRIGAGALNGRAVAELARELGVSERHLRRALEREFGVSPVELAQTHRLLLAKRLLADTSLSVTHVAYASGFQSLRRFNTVFRERYRLSPTAVRRVPRSRAALDGASAPTPAPHAADPVALTLAYRPPLAFGELLSFLSRSSLPCVEVVEAGRYGRTVRLDGHCGIVSVTDVRARGHLVVEVSPSLVPVLMPLLSRLRQLFDLDAEPSVIDAHLAQGGLGTLVERRPGARIPGTFDGFEAVLSAFLLDWPRASTVAVAIAHRVVEALGEEVETGISTLTRVSPSAAKIADVGAARLCALGVPRRRAERLAVLARAIADDELRLAPGVDPAAAYRALKEMTGARLASVVALRALSWPDAFPAQDRALQRAAGIDSANALRARAERWRPWRAYAAIHLWLQDEP